MTPILDSGTVSIRARKLVALRLLPFVFILYVVNYIDRVNVSFANLRMSAHLGFSDRVYGLGVGMFYLTYVLFEIPGAIRKENGVASKHLTFGTVVAFARQTQPRHLLA
jgi:hypothetical protein